VPGVIVAGLNAHPTPAGKPEHARLMPLSNEPPSGVIVMLVLALCERVIVIGAESAWAVKSATL